MGKEGDGGGEWGWLPCGGVGGGLGQGGSVIEGRRELRSRRTRMRTRKGDGGGRDVMQVV